MIYRHFRVMSDFTCTKSWVNIMIINESNPFCNENSIKWLILKFTSISGKHYSNGFGQGDVVGCLIDLPEQSGKDYLPITCKVCDEMLNRPARSIWQRLPVYNNLQSM